jgi:protein TonB
MIACPILVAGVLGIFASEAVAQPAQSRLPAPAGQEILVRDGDRVIIEGDARVQIARRKHGAVRTVYSQPERLLIVLIDYPANSGEPPDGGVDVSFRFSDVDGSWPLGERWEAFTTVDEYASRVGPVPAGLAIGTPQGFIRLIPSYREPDAQDATDPAAAAVLSFRGVQTNGPGRIPPISFDQAEQEEMANRAGRSGVQFGMGGSNAGAAGVSFWSAGRTSVAPGAQAVRVGGAMPAPEKIYDVAPVYPAEARQARIQGVVILEITVGEDGGVADARVLRSIPLLDEAALAAVRQWQYAPTTLNGAAVALTLTVTVPFVIN